MNEHPVGEISLDLNRKGVGKGDAGITRKRNLFEKIANLKRHSR